MQATRPPGLRERKRTETRARIESAATTLVLRDGLEETTVDAISELADVSPRTFFNYFESKDSAVLGLAPRDLDEDLHTFLADPAHPGGLVGAVVALVLAAMGTPTAAGTAVHRDRMEIIRRHPEIVGGQFAQLNARRERMAEAVRNLLVTHPDFGADDDVDAHAELVLALCASAARAAVREWADTARPGTVDTIEQRATALVASTLRRLT